MRLTILVASVLFCASAAFGAGSPVFINEFYYDSPGSPDTDEFIELAGLAGTNLSGWTLELVNGNNDLTYLSIPLPNFTFPDFTNTGWGFFVLGRAAISPDYDLGADNVIQNGSPDGIRLIDPSLAVAHFVSYEGAMPGADDVVPVSIFNDNVNAASIGKTGPTSGQNSGTWQLFPTPSPHFLNSGQDLVYVPEPGACCLVVAAMSLLIRQRRMAH